MPGTFVTQRFQRNGDGELFERKVAADMIVMLDAVVESKGYTAKIRVDVFDAIWARYDAGDYGSGKAGHAVYDDVETFRRSGSSTATSRESGAASRLDARPAADPARCSNLPRAGGHHGDHQEQPRHRGPRDWFTGAVYIDSVAAPTAGHG